MPKVLFTPTPENHAYVRSLATEGVSEADIAAELRIPTKKLQRLFKDDLRQGVAAGNRTVVKTLYTAAISGTNMNVTVFWVKSRYGWRDTGAPAEAKPFPWPDFNVNCISK
jgi:hypothetical protein